jgi:hypothetical protein
MRKDSAGKQYRSLRLPGNDAGSTLVLIRTSADLRIACTGLKAGVNEKGVGWDRFARTRTLKFGRSSQEAPKLGSGSV